MTSPTTVSGVQAAAVNGSWPLHQVALEGYVLEVFPAATPNNELLSLCVDPEAVTYHQWDCRVQGLFAVNTTASEQQSPPLSSSTFSQEFNMYLVPGSSGPAAPSLLLLAAAALLALKAAMD